MSIDLPEDFDLQTALRQESSTDGTERLRCPECLLAGASNNSGKWDQSESDYHCDECGHSFDRDDAVTGLSREAVKRRR